MNSIVRIMIIGCCGSGKSTMSRKLQQILELPLFHLDQYYWKPNWVETPKSEWPNIVQTLSDKDKWIVDGNYGGTMDIRLKRADTVIYLDYSTWQCLYRVIKRIIKYKGKIRPDMVEGCPERFNLNFLHYVLVFNLTRRNSILKKIYAYKNNLNVVVLKNDKQVEEYLSSLEVNDLML
jgi:adenylate kinase family enzyme